MYDTEANIFEKSGNCFSEATAAMRKKPPGPQRRYLVSAIVSTYNSERFIRGCLQDLENQTIRDKLEIIVVNSGSEQNEEAIVREYQQKFNNIIYVKTHERETIYHAWNRGIKAASGKYITNANTDDRHSPGMLEKLAAVLDKNKNVAAVYSHFYITTVENQTWETKTPQNASAWHPPYSRYELLRGNFMGPQPMWRKSLHDEYGYFDGSFKVSGDYEFFLRVSQTYDFLLLPEILGLYLLSYRSLERIAGTMDEENLKIWRLYNKNKDKIIRRPFRPDEPQTQSLRIDSPLSSKPRVSIIVACYNAEKFLAECLDSIINQSMKQWELFLLDDAATDGTSKIIQKYSEKDPRIKPYYFENNKGPGARWNFAIRQANSDFIIKHDADDIMCPGKLEVLYHEIAGDTRLGAVGAFYRSFIEDFRGPRYTDEHKLPLEHDEIVDGFSSWRHAMSHGSAVIRKKLFEAVGLYDEIPLCTDAFLFAKMAEYAKHFNNIKFKNVPLYLTLLRMHSGSQSRLLPYFDPRSRQYRYMQYCEAKLRTIRKKIKGFPDTDIKAELKNCTCSDFIEKYGCLFNQWESEPLDNNIFLARMGWTVGVFNDRRYVKCITALGDMETMERNLPERFENYDLLRAMAYLALDMKQQSLECLNREIQNHNSQPAKKFMSDCFEKKLKVDVQDWCSENGRLYDLRMIDKSETQPKNLNVPVRSSPVLQSGRNHEPQARLCTKQGPLVSVIMPAYNADAHIHPAIHSVLTQSHRNLELIVIDDGSTDRTKDVVLEFNDKRIKYFYKKNGGPSSARNLGIKNSKGCFIIVLDSDDMMHPEYVAKHLKKFQQHPDADLIYCDHGLITPRGEAIRVMEQLEYENRRHLIRDMFRCGYAIIQPLGCFKKTVLDKIGNYDERLMIGEDYDLMRRFVKAGLKAYHLKGPFYLRKMRPESLSRIDSPQKADAHFTVVKRLIGTFTHDELFPDVDWAGIPQTRVELHAKCLVGATLLAIAQNYRTTNQPFKTKLALDHARRALNECLTIDPNHQKARHLLSRCRQLDTCQQTEAKKTVCLKM